MLVIEMSIRQKSRIERSSIVVVVVRATKEISRTALTWAFTNVVQPGDCVRLLVLIPSHSSSNYPFPFLYWFIHFCSFDQWRNVYTIWCSNITLHFTIVSYEATTYVAQFFGLYS